MKNKFLLILPSRATSTRFSERKSNIAKRVEVVMLGLIFLLFPLFIKAQETSLFLFPTSKILKIGEEFLVELKVETDFPVNAAEANIKFPMDKLEVLEISKKDSIFSFWPEEPNILEDKIHFSGGLPHPGFSGTGKILEIKFRAKDEGMIFLNFEEGKVLADDGKGTNILSVLKEGKYSIQKEISISKVRISPSGLPLAPEIISFSHPAEEEWYNNNNPHFEWNLSPEIIGVSFVLDQSPETIPDDQSEEKIQSKIFENLEDGIWYFHLKLENENGWGDASHRKVEIDTHPPHPFSITIDNQGDPTNPQPNLYFETIDDISGISLFKLKIGEESFIDLTAAQINPFLLPLQRPGSHLVKVRAIDEAGNAAESRTVLNIEPIESPKIILWPKTYLAGEETFYVEGVALPNVNIILFLKKNGDLIKEWETVSDSNGNWSFSTRELVKSGKYYLSAQARDERGVLSNPTQDYEIEIFLSGISIGPLAFTFKSLIFGLFLVLILALSIILYITRKAKKVKNSLRSETWEAEEVLKRKFEDLKKEIEKKIEFLDSKPGMSKKEKKLCQDLKDALKKAEKEVNKEIEDIEKLIK